MVCQSHLAKSFHDHGFLGAAGYADNFGTPSHHRKTN